VLHVISGGDSGGAKTHLLTLLGRLRREVEVPVVCFMAGDFYREALASGLDCVLLRQRARFDLSVVPRFVRLVRSGGYQVVHAHGGRANFVTALAKPWLGVPLCTTVHSDYRLDWEGQPYKKFVFTTLNAAALRAMDYFLAVSGSFRDMLVSRGFPVERIFVIYNGVDFERQMPAGDWQALVAGRGVPLEPGGRLVGTVGRLHPVKGQDVFIRAARQVLDALGGEEPVRFLVAGDGPELPRLKALARGLGIADRVHFLGHLEDVDTFLAGLDVNVVSSYTESFPYVILEAARLRKVSVSTAVGGIPELIRHGETGFLFAPGDSAALAAALVEALRDRGRLDRLGEAVYRRAREHFSAEAMARRHLEIYETILAR